MDAAADSVVFFTKICQDVLILFTNHSAMIGILHEYIHAFLHPEVTVENFHNRGIIAYGIEGEIIL